MLIAGVAGGLLHACVELLRRRPSWRWFELGIALVVGGVLGVYLGPAGVSAFDLSHELGLAAALAAGAVGWPLVVFVQELAGEFARERLGRRRDREG